MYGIIQHKKWGIYLISIKIITNGTTSIPTISASFNNNSATDMTGHFVGGCGSPFILNGTGANIVEINFRIQLWGNVTWWLNVYRSGGSGTANIADSYISFTRIA